MELVDKVEEAIKEWAKPDDELGWDGSSEVAQHAHEIAGYLWEQNLLKDE